MGHWSLQQMVHGGRETSAPIPVAKADAFRRDFEDYERYYWNGRKSNANERGEMVRRKADGGDTATIFKEVMADSLNFGTFADAPAPSLTPNGSAPTGASAAGASSSGWFPEELLSEEVIFPNTYQVRTADVVAPSGASVADGLARSRSSAADDAPASAVGPIVFDATRTAGDQYVLDVVQAARTLAANGFESSPAVLKRALLGALSTRRKVG